MSHSKPSLSWNAINLTTVDIARLLKAADYDIDPSHQRNVVHNLQWKRSIIDSCFGFAPADIPATYWQPRDTADKTIYESVDGKQRIKAIIDFIDNDFTWKGKYYSHKTLPSLKRAEKKKFSSFMLVVKQANRTLTSKELADSFKKFQQTKTTKLGEILHATKGKLSELMDAIMHGHSLLINKIFSQNGRKRFQPLEVYARCLYLFLGGKSSTANAVKILWDGQVEQSFTLPSDRKIRLFRSLMRQTFNLLTAKSNAGIRSRPSKFIPLFMLMHWSFRKGTAKHAEHTDYLMENLATIMKSSEFADVGGKHNAALTRFVLLKEKVSGGEFSDALSGEEDAPETAL